MTLVLLLGGARSGKSSLAVELAREAGAPVTFVATAEGRDDEMRERIERHRADRPSEWTTVEEPVELRRALDAIEPAETAVVDCLSLWVSNLVERGWTDAEVEEEAADLAKRAASRPGLRIAVSNEAGLGVVPATPLGRRWRDLLGRVNERWAREAGDVFLVVAGRVLPLERMHV